jgi:hypothetical protein
MSSPFAAPYTRPAVGSLPPAPVARRSAALGTVALVAAVVVVPIAAAIAAVESFRIGLGAGKEIASRPTGQAFDWSILSPVRYDVLVAEIVFWTATTLGLWALVQGIVAVVTARGRGQGIGAIVVAAVGPVLFFVAVAVLLNVGIVAGSGIGG